MTAQLVAARGGNCVDGAGNCNRRRANARTIVRLSPDPGPARSDAQIQTQNGPRTKLLAKPKHNPERSPNATRSEAQTRPRRKSGPSLDLERAAEWDSEGEQLATRRLRLAGARVPVGERDAHVRRQPGYAVGVQ